MTTFNYKTYPAITTYFKTTFPKLPTAKPQIFKHFKAYSLFDKADAVKVLKTGWTPRVKIRRIQGRYGNTPTTGDAIELDRLFLQDVEAILGYHFAPSVYDYYRIKARVQLLIEITTLHELVHWCRQQVNGVNWNRNEEERIARRFEGDAYGRVHDARSLGIDAWVR